MQQTIESFENYINSCKEEASKMLPPVNTRECALCSNGTAYLLREDMTHEIDEAIWKGRMLYYKCGKCSEEFTTNETDLLSIASYERIK